PLRRLHCCALAVAAVGEREHLHDVMECGAEARAYSAAGGTCCGIARARRASRSTTVGPCPIEGHCRIEPICSTAGRMSESAGVETKSVYLSWFVART